MKKMIFALLLLAFVSVDARATDGFCEVSEWSDWRVPYHDPTISSYPNHDVPEIDPGRVTFARMMKEKVAAWAHLNKETASLPRMAAEQCVDGFAGDLPCQNIDQQSFVSLSELSWGAAVEGSDSWGWTDPQTSKEYAIVCVDSGTSFVDVTDAQNPQVIAYLESGSYSSSWRDAKVIGNFVYIVSEANNHGIQVFDLTRLRTVSGVIPKEAADAHYQDIGRCHNIIVNPETNFIYAVGCQQSLSYESCREGLHVVDVSNPYNPTFVGCFSDDGYVHDAQCLIYRGPDGNYWGREICFCYNEDTFTIVDVHDKGSMTEISRTSYEGYAYTHQGWLTDDQSVVLMDDESDEQQGGSDKRQRTYIWDVTDLSAPELKNTYYAAFDSIDHNQYIVGDLTYQSNYQSGLRVLSIDQANYLLSEVAYFDVHETSNAAYFNGAWNVYPYFSSGNVVISSIEKGLFMVKPDFVAINEAISAKKSPEKTRYREIIKSSSISACPPLTESELA